MLFQVWAPFARESLQVNVEGSLYALQQTGQGWWQAELPYINGDVDYAFLLDGESVYPDPASSWQPEGVHKPSRKRDLRSFIWSDAEFHVQPLSRAIFYELHIGTFTEQGTFLSAIDKLDALVDLGITHIELMPVAQFSGVHGWGYDGVYPYAPHNAYGDPNGLATFVSACHIRGLAVVLDVVYNHLGPDGNYLAQYGPYFTDHYLTPWGKAVNLDSRDSDAVRAFFIENALMWLRDYHLDGLRLDAVHALYDQSALHFLEELAAEVRKLEQITSRTLVLIAESDLNDPRLVAPASNGGYGFDAQWNDDFHHTLHVVLTGEQNGYYADYHGLEDLCKALTNIFVYDGRYSQYRGRRHGRPVENKSGQHFLVYMQNHDQVGNRAGGERISHLITPARVKIGAALTLLSPYVPMLWMGEEWGASTPFQYFTDYQDPVLSAQVSAGRRDEFVLFGWKDEDIPDPQDRETFLHSKLNWMERSESEHADLLAWYRMLIHLRRDHPAFTSLDLNQVSTNCNGEQDWLTLQVGNLRVVCCFSGEGQNIPLFGVESSKVLLASCPEVKMHQELIWMPPESVAVVETSSPNQSISS